MHAPDATADASPIPHPLAEGIVAALEDPLAVLDRDSGIVWANTPFAALVDSSPRTVLGKGLGELSGPRLNGRHLVSSLETAEGARRLVEDLEVHVEQSGEEEEVFLVTVRRLDMEDAQGPFVVLAMKNVTDRQELQREAREYARELERSNRELEDFAHAASHDLQEPLRKIRTYADRLPDLLDEADLGERAARYLTRLGEATERMQERTDALLQLARMGRQRPDPERLDLNDVVDEVISDLAVALRKTDAGVEVGDLPAVEADPVQMRVLFQNLISNALKFHDPDQRPVVRIHSSSDAAAGDGEAAGVGAVGSDPAAARVVVEDEGIGFEQEYADRIFGPFQRLHGRGEYGGSGVGLAMCRRVVEHHRGTIRAEGRPGVGARFIITLPNEQPKERTR